MDRRSNIDTEFDGRKNYLFTVDDVLFAIGTLTIRQ